MEWIKQRVNEQASGRRTKKKSGYIITDNLSDSPFSQHTTKRKEKGKLLDCCSSRYIRTGRLYAYGHFAAGSLIVCYNSESDTVKSWTEIESNDFIVDFVIRLFLKNHSPKL